MSTESFNFKNGDGLPAVGLGTWKSAPGLVGEAVKAAIEAGYRHIDCAKAYDNEAEIGEALADCFEKGLVKRSDLVITSKLWNDSHDAEHVIPALEQTLKDLKLEYLDIYLIHWPVAIKHGVSFPTSAEEMVSLEECPILATWRQLELAVQKGLVKHIGCANFSVKKLHCLMKDATIAPEVNQIELHPYLQRKGLVDYCHKHHVLVTGFSSLGSQDRPAGLKQQDEPILLKDDAIAEIAQTYNATPAQLLLKWSIQYGANVIPKSVRPHRLAENLDATKVPRISDQDMAKIAALDKNRKYVDGTFWAMEGSPYTVDNVWDEAEESIFTSG